MAAMKRLGELLVENNVIDRSQLEEALREQKRSGERLGKVLVELEYLTEQDIINVLEFQLGIKQVRLLKNPPDRNVLGSIPKQLAHSYKVVPYEERNGSLVVAMTDPFDVAAIDDLRMRTGRKIQPVIATEDEVNKTIQKYYGMEDIEEEYVPEDEAAEERDDGDEAPIVRVVKSMLDQAVAEGASDIHLEPEAGRVRVRYRVDGLLQEAMTLPLNTYASVVSRIKILAGMDIAEKRVPQDGRIHHTVRKRDVDIRTATMPTVYGEKIVLRLLDRSRKLFRLHELGLSEKAFEKIASLISDPYGMILVTGPTGSGKTTTLYAALKELNSIDKNIVTIEDPVEYTLRGVNQINVNLKAGLTFSTGLRSILRQDPDIIMVGEVRDTETAQIAVRAANTGHLVFSTLHTNDAASALTRMIDMGVEPYLVASSVTGVIAQRLVRKICEQCKESYRVPPGSEERVVIGAGESEEIFLYRGAGCSICSYTGYKGRLAIAEVIDVGSSLRKLVVNKESSDVLRDEVDKDEDFVSMREDGIAKAKKGLTSVEEVMRLV